MNSANCTVNTNIPKLNFYGGIHPLGNSGIFRSMWPKKKKGRQLIWNTQYTKKKLF